MGLLSSVGRTTGRCTTAGDQPGPETRNAPAQAHGARDAGTRRHADRTVLLRGPPGSPGPSIARGGATTSGLWGNADEHTPLGGLAGGPRAGLGTRGPPTAGWPWSSGDEALTGRWAHGRRRSSAHQRSEERRVGKEW